MPSLDETFKAVGVTSARDKILALCSAPALFFPSQHYSEDYIMVNTVAYVVGEILGNLVAPFEPRLKQHIKLSMFDTTVPEQDRRNMVYGFQTPSYLDAVIDTLTDLGKQLQQMEQEHRSVCSALVEAETNTPLLRTLQEYRSYNVKKAGTVA